MGVLPSKGNTLFASAAAGPETAGDWRQPPQAHAKYTCNHKGNSLKLPLYSPDVSLIIGGEAQIFKPGREEDL